MSPRPLPLIKINQFILQTNNGNPLIIMRVFFYLCRVTPQSTIQKILILNFSKTRSQTGFSQPAKTASDTLRINCLRSSRFVQSLKPHFLTPLLQIVQMSRTDLLRMPSIPAFHSSNLNSLEKEEGVFRPSLEASSHHGQVKTGSVPSSDSWEIDYLLTRTSSLLQF